MQNQIQNIDLPELLEHINDAIFVIDHDWRFVYLNQGAETLLLKNKEELLGVNIWHAFPEAVGSTFYNKYQEALRDNKEVAFTEYYPPLDTWFIVKAYPSTQEGLLVLFNNINELKQTEEKLRLSENKFRTLFEAMTLGVVYQDQNGKISSANPAAEEILGLSLDEMMGRVSADPRWKALDEKGRDLPGNQHPAMVALQSGKPVVQFVQRIFNPKQNDYRWLLVDSVPQFHEGEETPFQVFSLFRDITDKQKAVADREEIIHMVAHDMRSPLGSAMLLADMIDEQLSKANVSIKEVSYLKRALQRTFHLMNDVVDSVRLETNSLNAEKKLTSVDEFLKALDETQRPLIASAGLDWHIEAQTSGVNLLVADNRLHQVFENLISNAIRFTPSPGNIVLQAFTQNNFLVFKLSDSGKGIPHDQQDKIFIKYWQAGSKYKGTGLGLYLVKKIVEAHQGSISVHSEPNQGTTFIIQLPIPEEQIG